MQSINTPGVSLFQGADSIKVNTSLERAEEEEAIEDQKRRNEELGNLLQNAFDDLEDDETIDSTTNFQSDLIETTNQHLPQQQHMHKQQQLHHQQLQQEHIGQTYEQVAGGLANHAHSACEAEIHKLKMLLDSRSRELESIKQLANEEFKKRNDLQKRHTITVAELDRALATKKNTHELLVESKEKCSNLENTIGKLRNEKKMLESEHNSVLGQLETAQTLLADVQSKYNLVERDLNRQNDRNADMRRKQTDERHRGEIEMMQQQLEQLANKLEKKTNDWEHINARYQALQSSHEMMLLDKVSKINDLNNALNETQKRCEELMSKQDYFQENVRLQKLVANLQDQILAMEKTIGTLNDRLQFTTGELEAMDTVLHQHNLEDTPRRLSQTQGRAVGSTPLNTVDRVTNLKEELYRALASVKSKREEVRRLQQNLTERDTEIQALREEENNALVQITTLKGDKTRLENKLKILEEESEEMRTKALNRSANNSKIQMLTMELQQVREEKSSVEQERHALESERNHHELERKNLDLRLKNAQVDLEELKQEHESMKLNYEQMLKENQNLRRRTTIDNISAELEKHKILFKDSKAECDRLKNLYIEISNAKESLLYELQKMRNMDTVKELHESRERVANLQRALQLAEVQNSEISKIMDTLKTSHDQEVAALKETMEKERLSTLKASKEHSNNCTKCIDYMAEMTRIEIQNLKLGNMNSVNQKEIDDLTAELAESRALIAELTEKIKLCEHQEKLIKELKTKAHKFEEYIKSQSSSSEKSVTPPQPKTRCSDKSVTTSPELEMAQIRKIEARIRDEMAKIFACELKRFQMKLQQTEEKSACLQREYQHVSAELQQRHNEVEVLKQAIMAERDKMEEILGEKDAECRDVVQKHNVMLSKCRDELQTKNAKVTELLKELDDRQAQIEAERKSMKAVMAQWEEQSKTSDSIESEWKQKVQELKETHASAITSWQTKYNSAKRTAANYKRYAEDKEAHMLKEYDRIKFEYETSLAKIEVSMKDSLERKHREMKDAIAATAMKRGLEDEKENKVSN